MEYQEPTTGRLLISEPFMYDPNFKRTVIMLCEHNKEGSFGLVLNKRTEYMVGDAIPDLDIADAPLYFGGPVEPNTLHFLHTRPDLFEQCNRVTEHVFWGGDFDRLKFLLSTKQLDKDSLRFFIGYSGWSAGQLVEEIQKNSWIITDGEINNFFLEDEDKLWRRVLQDMGGKFKAIAHFPEDPSLN